MGHNKRALSKRVGRKETVNTQNVRPQVPRSLPSSFHYISPKLAFLMALESQGFLSFFSLVLSGRWSGDRPLRGLSQIWLQVGEKRKIKKFGTLFFFPPLLLLLFPILWRRWTGSSTRGISQIWLQVFSFWTTFFRLLLLLFPILWGRWSGDRPLEDLAKFGYRSKEECFKILGLFFLVFFQFCAGDSPQQDWARFGYRSERKVKKTFGIVLSFFLPY